MKLALKVDVDTLRGTREGLPRLLRLFEEFQAGATFLFSLGPDHTGRAIRRALRPGFMKKVSRTSVVGHYGWRTLMYGTLLPGPDIGRRCAEAMASVKNAGFEVGIHAWDHVRWQDHVEHADNAWVEAEMARERERFAEIFGEAAHTRGAAGWQMNRHALRLTQRLGFEYASDCRGIHPFLPVIEGELIRCPQVPTTLPTLDELIGTEGLTEDNVHEHLLALTAHEPIAGHVFTLHAELEGMKLLPVFRKLLAGWRDQGYDFTPTRAILEGLSIEDLPRQEILRGSVPGRSGTLMVQGGTYAARHP
jgi:peptidoglycan/xylan/chitin deacetylase (PgdA/CDA1 family)